MKEIQLTQGKVETILFTPDLRYKEQFETQGIRVISP